MRLRLFFLSSLICCARLLCAQSEAAPRYQVYAGYSFLSNSLNGVPGSRHALSGFDTALGFPQWRNIRFKVDFSGYAGTNLGAPQHPYAILAGGQYTWNVHREALFGEGLLGAAGANKTWPANGAQGQTASIAALLGGGVDTPVSRRFAWRVEGGYQYTYLVLVGNLDVPYSIPGLPRNFARVSSGLVVNF